LPVGTIPAGATRSNPTGTALSEQYAAWRAAVRAKRKHSIEILTSDGIIGGNKDKHKGKGKGKKQ
jgi:hypothetical protein